VVAFIIEPHDAAPTSSSQPRSRSAAALYEGSIIAVLAMVEKKGRSDQGCAAPPSAARRHRTKSAEVGARRRSDRC